MENGRNFMSKKKMLMLIVLGLSMLSAVASAAVTTFNPRPIDLQDLPHQFFYTWGINFTIPQGEKLTGATLTYYNIYDWTKESDDRLFTHLLDNPTAGVRAIRERDNQGGGDNFAGQGTLIGVWSDDKGGKPRNFDLVYDFGSLGFLDELNTYINTQPKPRQSNFGFGIDPDCHYYNCKVEFAITTTPVVPNPAAISLGGFGIMLVGWLRTRKTLR